MVPGEAADVLGRFLADHVAGRLVAALAATRQGQPLNISSVICVQLGPEKKRELLAVSGI